MHERALVTGGAGFIGAWIARRLRALGTKVRILDARADREPARAIIGAVVDDFDWIVGDVGEADVVLEAARDCDLLVHLAAVLTPGCQSDPIHGARVNVLGTVNVFEAARLRGVEKVLYMSSAGVFGPDDGVQPRPTTLYGAYKLAGEGCARAYFADHGIVSVGFRPLIVYGPGRETGLTAGPTLACRAAARSEPYTISFGGESDFVFVDDVAAAFEAAAVAALGGAEVYNVVGEEASLTEIASAIERIAPGARVDVDGPPIPIAPGIDEGTLRLRFPCVPRTTLRDGLERTVAFYRDRA